MSLNRRFQFAVNCFVSVTVVLAFRCESVREAEFAIRKTQKLIKQTLFYASAIRRAILNQSTNSTWT